MGVRTAHVAAGGALDRSRREFVRGEIKAAPELKITPRENKTKHHRSGTRKKKNFIHRIMQHGRRLLIQLAVLVCIIIAATAAVAAAAPVTDPTTEADVVPGSLSDLWSRMVAIVTDRIPRALGMTSLPAAPACVAPPERDYIIGNATEINLHCYQDQRLGCDAYESLLIKRDSDTVLVYKYRHTSSPFEMIAATYGLVELTSMQRREHEWKMCANVYMGAGYVPTPDHHDYALTDSFSPQPHERSRITIPAVNVCEWYIAIYPLSAEDVGELPKYAEMTCDYFIAINELRAFGETDESLCSGEGRQTACSQASRGGESTSDSAHWAGSVDIAMRAVVLAAGVTALASVVI